MTKEPVMNPMDFFALLLSLVFATLCLLAHGWTLNGVGPAVLSTAGGLWQLWMQWLRHKSYLRHRDSGFAPGTQHLACSATVGYGLGMVAAVVWALVALQRAEK
jgi:hypothetical protein